MCKTPYDWEAIYQDWRKSGLTLREYHSSNSFAALVGDRLRVPCYDTLCLHIRRVRRRDDVAVHSLTETQVQGAPAERRSIASDRPERERAQLAGLSAHHKTPVLIRLPNGASIQFESAVPEVFALRALQMPSPGVGS
jgi:hypothetical protein